MGPQDILTARKQKYYPNSNNLNRESIQGEMAEQKVTKVCFGKMYSPCCCRAAVSFGSLVSGENQPGYRSHHHVRVHTRVPVQRHCLAAGKRNPNIPMHGCPLQRRQACGASQARIFPHLLLFQKVLSYHPLPPHSTSPFPHVTGIQGKYFSQTLWSGVSPLTFRRPLYQARSRRAGQTLPQGHRESGLGV